MVAKRAGGVPGRVDLADVAAELKLEQPRSDPTKLRLAIIKAAAEAGIEVWISDPNEKAGPNAGPPAPFKQPVNYAAAAAQPLPALTSVTSSQSQTARQL